MEILITLVILLFSVIVHEVMHGIVAEKFGDETAREEGRITLNPIPHIDPFGSILLPGFLLFIGSPFVLGAAKPVPVNYNNMSRPKLGMALVSAVGPLSNIVLAIIFILPVTFGLLTGLMAEIWIKASFINVLLAVLNILPIPPLDGSKLLASLLPDKFMFWILSMEQFGLIFVIAILLLGVFEKILWPIWYLFVAIFG